MIFHENRLLVDDSHEIPFHYFCRKLGKLLQNLSSAAVVTGALRVNYQEQCCMTATPANPSVKWTAKQDSIN